MSACKPRHVFTACDRITILVLVCMTPCSLAEMYCSAYIMTVGRTHMFRRNVDTPVPNYTPSRARRRSLNSHRHENIRLYI